MKTQNSIVLRDEDSVGEVAFSDRITMPTERIFKDSGQMIAPCTLARVGVMLYKAKECGDLFKDKDPNSIVRIATFAEDLFHDESLQTYRSSPITIGHPEDDVNTENAKELVKGNLEGLPMADEKKENLQGTLVLNDADAIAFVKNGKSELSSGHRAVLVLNDAENPDMTFGGWDAKKTNIKNNHVAIVDHGRAGTARIADESAVSLKDMQVILDAVKDENESLKKEIQSLKDANAITEQKLADATSEDVVNALLQKKLDLVKEVTDLCDADIDFTKSDIEIKRCALEAAFDKSFKDKDDDYINIRYRIMKEEGVPAIGQRTDMQKELQRMHDSQCQSHSDEKRLTPAEQARARMITRHTKKKDK